MERPHNPRGQDDPPFSVALLICDEGDDRAVSDLEVVSEKIASYFNGQADLEALNEPFWEYVDTAVLQVFGMSIAGLALHVFSSRLEEFTES